MGISIHGTSSSVNISTLKKVKSIPFNFVPNTISIENSHKKTCRSFHSSDSRIVYSKKVKKN